MPRGNIDYKKGVIYKICCKDVNIKNIYIGSTTNFRGRKRQHKCACNNENDKSYNYYVYQFIRNNGGWNNWDLIEIEKYEATDIHNLLSRERHHIEELKASLNKSIPTRTKKEYREQNKKEIKLWKQKHYQENKEVIAEKQKEYREQNKEILAEKQKEYQQRNKQSIAEYKKEYQQRNKQSIAEKKKEKMTCECGSIILKCVKARHLKSNKHKEFLNHE